MAFEAFRAQDKRPKHLRRVVIGVAAVLHGALIGLGVVYSYWHVDELTPPTLRVTFISAMAPPPPPPPPPPAGGGSQKKKLAMKVKPTTPVLLPKPTDIVQPREKPAPVKKKEPRPDEYEDEDDDDAPKGVKGGVKGGIEGGEIGGTIGGEVGGTKGGTIGGLKGGTVGASVGPKILPPNLGALQKEGNCQAVCPISLRRPGYFYVVMAKICVSTTGAVESMTLLKRADSLLDEGVLSTEKACRYKPLVAGGLAVPFCYIARYEFREK